MMKILPCLARNFLFLGLSMLIGCSHIVVKPIENAPPPFPEIGNVLLSLINDMEQSKDSFVEYGGTSMDVLSKIGTPMGLQLYLRYRSLSIPLVEALKYSRDRVLMERLFDLSEWSNNADARTASLVTLGSFTDPKDQRYFEAALRDEDVSVRAAAVEALEVWGLKEAKPLLLKAMEDPWSPLVQTLAIKALLVQGDPVGIPILVKNLQSGSWVIQAMSARYLGEYGSPQLQTTLYSAFNKEVDNDFVAVELAVATLKLLAKKDPRPRQEASASKQPKLKDRVEYWYGEDQSIEMEPLVLVPPRFYIREELAVAGSINQRIIDFLKSRLDLELNPTDRNDPNLQDLFKLRTPFGVSLKTRYSNISIPIAESLGGTNDPFLRSELLRAAEYSRNPLTRAISLIALAYNRNDEDLRVISQNLTSDDPVVRFGAMEAAIISRFEQLIPELINIAVRDPIPAFQLFAAYVLLSTDNMFGRHTVLTNLRNHDWPGRAMAHWYLGRYGEEKNFSDALNQLSAEQNPFVKAEIVLAIQRLAPEPSFSQ